MRTIANHGGASLQMIEVPAGKQSADIHIGSYLGYLAGSNPCETLNIHIISKDTDYDNVLKFWKEKTGIHALRTAKIKEDPAQPAKAAQQAQQTKAAQKKAAQNTKPLPAQDKQAAKALPAQDKQQSKALPAQAKEPPKALPAQAKEPAPAASEQPAENASTPSPSTSPESQPVTHETTSSAKKKPARKSASADSAQKVSLNNAVQKALSAARYDSKVINDVASLVATHLGEKHLQLVIHNELQKSYANYLDIYAVIKPVIAPYDAAADTTPEKSELPLETAASKPDAPEEPASAKPEPHKEPTAVSPNQQHDATAETPRAYAEIEQLLAAAGLDAETVDSVCALVEKNAGQKNAKMQIYRGIISAYGQDKGLKVYSVIRKSL